MSNKVRNSNIECLRIVAMLMIIYFTLSAYWWGTG